MNKVVVIGGGGHAKVIADLLRGKGFEIVGCTDSMRIGSVVNGMPVLGSDEEVLPRLMADGVKDAFVAIGDNALRRKISLKCASMGFQFPAVIGRSSVISESCKIGNGVAIMEGVVINADSDIQDFSILNTNSSVDHDCTIGAFAHIAPGCTLAGNVSIGKLAFLGAGTRVIPGCSVIDGIVVGAGSVVIRDLAQRGVWVGSPARMIKALD